MLQWLGANLEPVQLAPEHRMQLTTKEEAEMREVRKARVAELLRRREGWEERAKKPWLQFM